MDTHIARSSIYKHTAVNNSTSIDKPATSNAISKVVLTDVFACINLLGLERVCDLSQKKINGREDEEGLYFAMCQMDFEDAKSAEWLNGLSHQGAKEIGDYLLAFKNQMRDIMSAFEPHDTRTKEVFIAQLNLDGKNSHRLIAIAGAIYLVEANGYRDDDPLMTVAQLFEKCHNKNYDGLDLSGLDLRGADFSGASFIGTLFVGADLRRTNFNGSDLSEADLSKAMMQKAKLQRAVLYKTNLSQTNLHEADFYHSYLHGTNLHQTMLTNAILNWAELINVNLSEANLAGAFLFCTDLTDPHFDATNLINTHMHHAIFTFTKENNKDEENIKKIIGFLTSVGTQENHKGLALRAMKQLVAYLQKFNADMRHATFKLNDENIKKITSILTRIEAQENHKEFALSAMKQLVVYIQNVDFDTLKKYFTPIFLRHKSLYVNDPAVKKFILDSNKKSSKQSLH